MSKTKLLIIEVSSGAVREVEDSRWCLCALDGDEVLLADKETYSIKELFEPCLRSQDGSIYGTEHALSHSSFPGQLTLRCSCSGSHREVNANCIEKAGLEKVITRRYVGGGLREGTQVCDAAKGFGLGSYCTWGSGW